VPDVFWVKQGGEVDISLPHTIAPGIVKGVGKKAIHEITRSITNIMSSCSFV
jgi:hypothetical protein